VVKKGQPTSSLYFASSSVTSFFTMRLDMSATMSDSSTATASALSASEAGNDDIEDGDNSADDCVEYRSNSIDDGHEAVTNRAQDALDT